MPPAYEILLLNTAVPQIQAAQSGDTYVVPRDIAFSAALTLSAGTANGVPYLNGSKVLTSGSALTFDGLTIVNNQGSSGTSIAGNALLGLQHNVNAVISFNVPDANAAGIFFGYGGNPYWAGVEKDGAVGLRLVAAGNSAYLTSTGLGIGTSSPGYPLEVRKDQNAGTKLGVQNQNSGASALAGIDFQAYGGGWQIEVPASTTFVNPLRFSFNASEKMRLDSSGNLGLGVTPSAWASGWPALQVGSRTVVHSATDGRASFGNNYYVDSTPTARYLANGAATQLMQVSGDFRFFTAPSGTAGNAISFSQVMTLDASGRLGIGVTSPNFLLDVAGDTEQQAEFARTGTTTGASYARFVNFGGSMYIGVDSSVGGRITNSTTPYAAAINTSNATPLIFGTDNSERARIKSTGQFRFVPLAADPSGAEAGDVYYNSGTNKLRLYDGTSWVDLN